MKTKNIFVGVNGATLALTSGKGIAVYPPQKGVNHSAVLMESGKLVTLKGARINGVGVPRFLKDNGFELAKPGDEAAAKLADMLDVREGTELVSRASIKMAGELQAKFARATCTFVPFDADKEIRPVDIEPARMCTTTMFDLVEGFSSGMVNTVYVPGSGYMDVALSAGWLVGPDGDAAKLPRVTEYGGLIERAVYTICHCGLGTLVGAQNLVPDENAAEDAPFPRGSLEIELANGDRLVIGSTGADELGAQYHRAGALLYSRVGMTQPRLGEVIGDIAAVLVRVNELDAESMKNAVKKAA